METEGHRLDYIYLTPAILCITAFLAGIVPYLFCLNSKLFAFVSVGIFGISILAHIYILFLWKRYKDSSPLAYALAQPIGHAIIMALALAVGSTNVCTINVKKEVFVGKDNGVFQGDVKISKAIETPPK